MTVDNVKGPRKQGDPPRQRQIISGRSQKSCVEKRENDRRMGEWTTAVKGDGCEPEHIKDTNSDMLESSRGLCNK